MCGVQMYVSSVGGLDKLSDARRIFFVSGAVV